jgi:hypothetical protein
LKQTIFLNKRAKELQEEIDKEKAIELQKLLFKILKELACNL